MLKLIGMNIPASLFISRSYGSQRSKSNHYETLCIKNNASQKEIRDAFIKLSKEHHPDIGNKGSHSQFVKVNEAYNILSKDFSRKQYDFDLKCRTVPADRGQTYYHHAGREYYDHPRAWGFEKGGARSENDYSRMKGMKQMSNKKVALICVVVGIVLFSLQVIGLRSLILRNQKYLKERSVEAERVYKESRTFAESMTREEQLEALQNRLNSSKKKTNLVANER